MRFLFNVIDDRAGSATADEQAAISAFDSRLKNEGHWVLAAGVGGPDPAVTVDNRGGAGRVMPGPFVRTAEHVVGFWVIDAADLDEAIELATEASRCCNRKVEVRAFL
ncbi:YciI family protein [Demequina iriomotensis]|uniref:YciI family protein n=1 Tax=Demequina iriomotensis TaxID=1536641 RepID=UPI000781F2F3|nr:YciI family protein [Demequina iriomotensis]